MTRQKTIRIALAGCGTVGGGVCEIINSRGESLVRRTGLRFEVVRALVRDKSKSRSGVSPQVLTTDVGDIVRCEPDMVVEVMGGTTVARDIVLGALKAGIPVVTANKALLAEHGAEVYRTARQNGTCVTFEASCAGGLPIVGALLHGLLGNHISRILGIFNSTCNFVLTQMLDFGLDFDAAVSEAQQAGYAEADPTLDVSGGDTAHKLAILASLAFGANVELDNIFTTGIDGLSLTDLRIARELGFECKLLGVGERRGDEVAVEVRPTLVRRSHPLAPLSGTSSGVLVDGDVVGQTFYAGAGAGSLPTASAVVADMIEVAFGSAQRTFDAARMFNDQTAAPSYLHHDRAQSPFYVRFDAQSVSAEKASDGLKSAGIGILRSETIDAHRAVTILTKPCEMGRLREAVLNLANQSQPPVILHVLADESV